MPRSALRLVPVIAIWAGTAVALAIPARRVVDWFWMTDELLYERLAFSVARTGSPLPVLHGQRVPVTNFLYPVLLSPLVDGHLVPSFLTRAHTLNAVLMTSACIPAYLIARGALRSPLGAYAAALLTVLVPWVVLASFLLTESAAYPAFLWAVYLAQRAVARPSPANDVLALAGLVLALLARTQLLVLFAVVPIAILLRERSLRASATSHRVFAAVTVAGIAAVVVLVAAGHGSGLLGSYAGTTNGAWISFDMLRAFTQHAATLAKALGILPAVLGAAWLSTRAVRRESTALVGSLAILFVLAEVTSFDVRFGGDLPHDRYLFYAAPLLLIGFIGALEDVRVARWSLAAPFVVVVIGMATAILPLYDKLNVETPASTVDNYLVRSGGGITGARVTLVVCAVLIVAIYLLARAFLPLRLVAVLFVAATAVFLTAETAYAFKRLFTVYGTAGRPITVSQGGVFDWIDRTVGPKAHVTFATYAQIHDDYNATSAYWWDLEFWNRSVVRAWYPGGKFAEIQSTFPRVDLHFDPRTGRANISPTRYLAQSDQETRFRVSGPTVSVTRNVRLIDAGTSWRAAWLSSGLDDDGFTLPGRPAAVRVFASPGQTKPALRYVSFQLQAGDAPEGAVLTSNAGRFNVALPPGGDTFEQAMVCVPPRGYGTIHLAAHGTAEVYGDMGTKAGIGNNRIRGVRVLRISLADETGSC